MCHKKEVNKKRPVQDYAHFCATITAKILEHDTGEFMLIVSVQLLLNCVIIFAVIYASEMLTAKCRCISQNIVSY